ADLAPSDYNLRLGEVTAYAAAWKSGETWPVAPNSVPISYVTRAGMIWRQGEEYHFDPTINGPPLWWVPGIYMPFRALAPVSTAQAIRHVAPVGPNEFEVSITLPVLDITSALALEETLPAGTLISEPGDGTFDARTRSFRWGP